MRGVSADRRLARVRRSGDSNNGEGFQDFTERTLALQHRSRLE
jgi:hypothetical protein